MYVGKYFLPEIFDWNDGKFDGNDEEGWWAKARLSHVLKLSRCVWGGRRGWQQLLGVQREGMAGTARFLAPGDAYLPKPLARCPHSTAQDSGAEGSVWAKSLTLSDSISLYFVENNASISQACGKSPLRLHFTFLPFFHCLLFIGYKYLNDFVFLKENSKKFNL